ncbi:MAG: response regulator transcription factor [Ignavibacteriales bacterium]|nr:response regulator transcription factor [Ignavibacteriales bacterium]
MIKIFIADDHVLILEGVKKILREESDMIVVGEARSGIEILERIGKSDCDILLLDLSLPDKPGLDVLKDIKKRFPHLHVLILSMFPEEVFAVRALKAGADGYLTKDSAAKELVVALRKVADGRKYVSDALSQELAVNVASRGGRAPHEDLSDREFQVLRMIGAGKTVTHIAAELNVSVSTVNTHRMHILEKMGMHTNAELMHYAIENKLGE